MNANEFTGADPVPMGAGPRQAGRRLRRSGACPSCSLLCHIDTCPRVSMTRSVLNVAQDPVSKLNITKACRTSYGWIESGSSGTASLANRFNVL